jgi:parallel beta-helix repeat protein
LDWVICYWREELYRKIGSGILLALLVTSMLTATFNIQSVKASGTIYIRADGSIDPPTANITSFDNITYTLTDNVNDSIVVERDNIVIDGADYTLQGTGSGTGIYLSRTNVTVRNTQIKNFGDGIWLDSSGNTISGNDITANAEYGIFDSSGNTISGNNITNNYYGIWLFDSSNNNISGNNIADNSNGGIILSYGSNNTIVGNVFTNNGLVWFDSYENVVEDNLVNDKPLVYLEGASYWKVDEAGQIILIDCEYIQVENLDLSHANLGLQLWNTNNTTISGNNITANNYYGIWLHESSNNTIYENNITANSEYAIDVYWYSNNRICGNNITANGICGIRLRDASNNNSISENNITSNGNGIEFDSSWSAISGNNITNNQYGIVLAISSSNVISGNNVTNNYYGIYLWDASNNIISENNITNNRSGFGLTGWKTGSLNNVIYHNNVVTNTIQVDEDYRLVNTWDDGYPSGGNYWSDYVGVDARSGPGQDLLGSDGVGDTQHIIDAGNGDRYPLMKPYAGPNDVGITSVETSKTIVGQGYCVNISVKIINYGEQPETFNVAIQANSTPINSQTITLTSRNSATVTFTWNTSGFERGNYTLTAVIDTVPDETDATDNTRESGLVLVGVPCDITGPTPQVPDGVCNMRDIGYMCSKFGTRPSNPNWDPNADVTGPTPRLPDGVVNMRDIGEACSNFMKT